MKRDVDDISDEWEKVWKTVRVERSRDRIKLACFQGHGFENLVNFLLRNGVEG